MEDQNMKMYVVYVQTEYFSLAPTFYLSIVYSFSYLCI